MNRIYQGKVTAVEIPAPHILSASIPFSASDGEMPLAHRMGEGGRRPGEGLRLPDEVFPESGERNKGEMSKSNPRAPLAANPKTNRAQWQSALAVSAKPGEAGWRHHESFQDAVN